MSIKMCNKNKLHSLKLLIFSRYLVLIFTFLFSANLQFAQPSGGPYGPIRQKYELPKVSGEIYYVAPNGKPDVAGDKIVEPTTLESAIAKVKTGDAIVLRGGIYRTGDLEFNQGITIQPYGDEQPIVKGTFEAKDWKDIGHGLWKTSWDRLFPETADDWWRRDRFGKNNPMHLFNNDMVFVDGKYLKSVGWEGEVDENSFYIDYATKSVYIGIDPSDKLVEITAFKWGLHRVTKEIHGKISDKKGPLIRGIVFTQYAYAVMEIDGYEPQGLADPSTFGKDVVGTIIENCTLSFGGRVGAYLRGDNLVMRNCKVHDTSTEGIYLLSSSDCLLEKNMFSRNNIENIIGYYPAVVKIFNQTHRVTCRDNLIYDLPLSNGIWYDVGNVDGRFVNNWIEGVGDNSGLGSNNRMWPSNNGFFFEISKGAICAGNVFVNCDHAMMILNSSNVRVYNNTMVNSTVCIGRDKRSAEADHFGWHPSTGPGVEERFGHVFVNNLLTSDKNYQRPLMLVWQHPDLCQKLDKSPLKQYDYNVFVRDADNKYKTIVYWSPVANEQCQLGAETLTELQKLSGAMGNGKLYENFEMPLFQSPELKNFKLQQNFPGATTAISLPDDVQKILGLPKKQIPYIGAYSQK